VSQVGRLAAGRPHPNAVTLRSVEPSSLIDQSNACGRKRERLQP